MPTLVLGIDAAWTNHKPSAVALLRLADDNTLHCLCVAPSYQSFLQQGAGLPIDWNADPVAGPPNIPALIAAATQISGGDPVRLVAADLPLSHAPIDGRRHSDNLLSAAFANQGCGTHSPNEERPGQLSEIVRDSALNLGYPLVTNIGEGENPIPALIETYPHPAIVRLLHANYRLPYKAGKTLKYWPEQDLAERKISLLGSFHQLLAGLAEEIEGIHLEIPHDGAPYSLQYLKRFEDALDSLVCGWVGARYLTNAAESYGDEVSAIWVPDE